MKTAQYIQKIIIHRHFIITFIERSVSWLNNSKIAVVSSLSNLHKPLSRKGTEVHCDMK